MMIVTFEELKSTLSNLPAPQRAELVQYLLESLDEPEAGATEEWQKLAEQRIAEIRSGAVKGIPAEVVLESLQGRRP
jgi:putative addiction module component (TIGR02574 family)